MKEAPKNMKEMPKFVSGIINKLLEKGIGSGRGCIELPAFVNRSLEALKRLSESAEASPPKEAEATAGEAPGPPDAVVSEPERPKKRQRAA